LSLSIANRHASLPVAYRLYLPEQWAADDERRRKTGVLEDIRFRAKPEIAIEQIRAASAAGLPFGVVLMDAGYGCNTDLRSSINAPGLTYVARISAEHHSTGAGHGAVASQTWPGRGRPPKLIRRNRNHRPTTVKELALSLPATAWRKIAWREGSARPDSCPRALPGCVYVAHRDYNLTKSRPEERLLIE
jgi:SRSO17 transposase